MSSGPMCRDKLNGRGNREAFPTMPPIHCETIKKTDLFLRNTHRDLVAVLGTPSSKLRNWFRRRVTPTVLSKWTWSCTSGSRTICFTSKPPPSWFRNGSASSLVLHRLMVHVLLSMAAASCRTCAVAPSRNENEDHNLSSPRIITMSVDKKKNL